MIFLNDKYKADSIQAETLSQLNSAYSTLVPAIKEVLNPACQDKDLAQLQVNVQLQNLEFYSSWVLKEFKIEANPPVSWFLGCLSKVFQEISQQAELGFKTASQSSKNLVETVIDRVNRIRQEALGATVPPKNLTMPPPLVHLVAEEPPEPPREIHMLAVDVEAAGSQPRRYPTISIAFCHTCYDPQRSQMTLVEQRRFSVLTTREQFEPKCFDEYWSKNMDRFDNLQRDAKSYEETACAVVEYVTGLMTKHPAIEILSDNVTLDIARLNDFFEAQGKKPISYRPDGVYQPPIDISSMARAVAVLKNAQDVWSSRHITTSLLYDDPGAGALKANPTYKMCYKYISFIDVLQKIRLKNGIHILGIDVKTGGSQLMHPIVSLGLCHSVYDIETDTFTFLHMKRFNFQVQQEEFEPICWEECWQHRKEALKMLQEHAKPRDEAAKDAVQYLEKLLQQYPYIQVVSDNLTFDVVRLNSLLESQGKEPISFRPDGKFQMPIDVAQIETTLGIVKSTRNVWARHTSTAHLTATLESKDICPVPANHTPDRAALIISWRYAKLMQELHKYSKLS